MLLELEEYSSDCDHAPNDKNAAPVSASHQSLRGENRCLGLCVYISGGSSSFSLPDSNPLVETLRVDASDTRRMDCVTVHLPDGDL